MLGGCARHRGVTGGIVGDPKLPRCGLPGRLPHFHGFRPSAPKAEVYDSRLGEVDCAGGALRRAVARNRANAYSTVSNYGGIRSVWNACSHLGSVGTVSPVCLNRDKMA